ncbi:uncharacterized protein LOC114921708 [Xyrichtys novacula]|uniref:Uncharacterized protein LOC114921708 n=1 Tax=Xyrichtys novacula TaxID=13765 RepID=A0AAV1GLE6_XYRNO|nr:uncharacterized protein LOC114921708 [Xyrichtys novacula]
MASISTALENHSLPPTSVTPFTAPHDYCLHLVLLCTPPHHHLPTTVPLNGCRQNSPPHLLSTMKLIIPHLLHHLTIHPPPLRPQPPSSNHPTSRPAQDFLDILNHCNFTQHINFPTHKHGHILDPVCFTNITISNISSNNLHISDHHAISLDIHIPQPSPTTSRTITFRKLTPLSPAQFALQMVNSIPTSPPPPSGNTGDLIKLYNSTLLSCLDNIAPIHQRTVSFRRPAPW